MKLIHVCYVHQQSMTTQCHDVPATIVSLYKTEFADQLSTIKQCVHACKWNSIAHYHCTSLLVCV